MGASASSSSSSSSLPPKKYDVFISFRDEDTRSNFTSHLHNALCQKSIRTFIDHELQRGDEISQSLIQAIRDSSISLVVFSENYASSKWCLDELTQILQCRKYHGQVIIPVFYKVDPSDVRKQNGSYKEAFIKHERDFIHDQHKVNGWRDALFETTNLAGWDSRSYMNESELIQNIVSDVLQKLDLQYPSAIGGFVGIDENCKDIELLLEEAPIIGIWGMGGIGKTTMAKVVFAKISSQYESCCFLENLREEEEKHGLTYIRDKLLFELLKEKDLHDSTPKVVGSKFVMRRLRSKKFLIVLDDVNSSKQLEYLAQECNCLGPNSKVIITTRDKHLLVGRVNKIYVAKALNYQESLKLFSFKAFHKDHLEIGYEEISTRAIYYAQGIPLALIVLGSFLHSKTLEEWDSALKKLEKTPHEDIQEVLKLSYNGLNYEEREMFLEIACFLKGEFEEDVIMLLESYGFHAKIGFRTLVDRALITIDYRRVQMHDLIQKMGWEIVRQECFKEPGKRSRLWDPEEVSDVLENNRGTDAIEGIMLDVSQIRDINLSADTFKKMTGLRFLKFYSSRYEGSCHMNFPSGLESFPNRLRYLHWYSYPLESLPSTFCPQKLIELCMENNHVKKLWDGVQDFVNLKRINLRGSKQLMELPDLSKAQKLESMDLSNCENLCNVHPSILSLHTLVFLRLQSCIRLKSLKSENHLKSLSNLDVFNCRNLKEFSLSSEKMKDLRLFSTGIEVLHSSIGRFRKLETLSVNCSTLKSLPIKELSSLTSLENLHLCDCGEVIDEPNLHILFEGLRSLRYLHLEKCSNLSTLPGNISSLSSLFQLGLSGSSIKNLPASIKHLTNLKEIDLRNCKMLRSLPELPPLIACLYAQNCVSLLETVFPSTSSILRHNEEDEEEDYAFRFENCVDLDEHSPIVEFAQLLMKAATYNDCHRVEICYPGSRVPEWFRYKQRTETSVTIELAKSFDDLKGFIFCSVISSLIFMEEFVGYLICHSALGEWDYWMCEPKLNSDHVFLWYYPGIEFLDDEKEFKKEFTFKFFFHVDLPGEPLQYDGSLNHLIKACGVYPIYDSECNNLFQQMELELDTKAKRPRDIDEQEQPLSTKDLEESSKVEHVPLRLELELGAKTKRPQDIDDINEQEQVHPTKKIKGCFSS